ncbi:hypothetical protein NV379_12670 [Paenibacillus sp. N1-5-1-14]|uniref:hypothetical protein n=1 Tax=Paenibacillus radicibacter TaxID=2972488 RepID=UPI002158F782|nr:hypothetical protein [Paenibacillus radicibacter]MCR8643507.1 hypothetical protein [Paenibacillus radicibacter]
MTYQEKKSIVSIVSVIAIFVSFCLYMYPFPNSGLESIETFRFWGSFVFILILVSIIANIVINIVFNIMYRITTGENEPTFEDELDRMINLKATRNSYFVFILGFLLAMGSVIVFQPSQLMFMILIISGFMSDVTGSITRLYHYRKGV